MLSSSTKYKFFDLLVVFAAFFTPLLFFIDSHDQFELPKLTFLALLTLPYLAFELTEKEFPASTPLSLALWALLACQTLASLPATSLSWRTSLLGEYENFAGLTTLLTYLVWFSFLSRALNESRIQKILYFNSIAAFLSALYAIGQHFGFDFIQWNADSVSATRKFAALGNPNFLSAYLAMSLILYLILALKNTSNEEKQTRPIGPLFWFLALLGGFLLFLGTDKGLNLVHFPPSDTFRFISRFMGLFCFSAALVRLSQFGSLPTTFAGWTILSLGLESTESRGGFIAAIIAIILWFTLVLRDKETVDSLRRSLGQKIKSHPFASSLFLLAYIAVLILYEPGFYHRLGTSVLNPHESMSVSRLHIWGPGLEIVKTKPLLGIGLDNFKIAFPYYSGIEFNLIDGMFTSSRMAHNELLQMAATTGLLGLAAYLGVIVVFGFMGWKSYRSATPIGRWVLIGVFSAALAFHVQNFFSFGVATINFLWFFFLATVQFYYRKTREKKTLTIPWTFLWKGTVLLFVLSILLFPLQRFEADVAFGHGSAASDLLKKSRPGQDRSTLDYYSDFEIYHLRKAADLFPLEVKYRLYLGLAYEHRASLDPSNAQDWFLKALDSYQKAIAMSPANAYYYNDEGRVYDELSGPEPSYLFKTVESYRQAVHWAPSSPFFLINWALSLKKIGKEEDGEEQLQKAFTYSPASTVKMLDQMSELAYQQGNKRTAFELADTAVRGNTSSAEAYYYRGYLYKREKEKKKALEDFERVKALNPSPEKNPTIQLLDQLIEEAKK